MESTQSNEHIIWHKGSITKNDRQSLNDHKSLIIWFTGLSGSGKSTLANAVEKILYSEGIRTYLLDGDNIRHGINNNLGFSSQDRKENIRRIAEVGKLFVDAGIIVLVAVISPYAEDRAAARNIFGKDEFIEVFVNCPLNECEARDPKGLYKKARTGEIQNFTGISQPYEEPESPEIIVDSVNSSLSESTNQVYQYIKGKLNLKGTKKHGQ
ncbi:adenylyl-sulfate kinase [Bacillus sp. JJ1562]|uniref:adenylyl-sulfate kinase n=1 Tax=Bacillus sp. JJ1562 TaxID=3122960 RepID=UPI003001C9E8